MRSTGIALLLATILATMASAARETTLAANGKLAFVRGNAVYVINNDGSAPKQLTRPRGGKDEDPAWSPNGKRLVFARNCGIFVINANGTRLRRLTRRERLCAYEPVWSPDGSSIAFVKRRRIGGLNVGAVYVMSANGQRHRPLSQRRINRNSFDDSFPAWSPDGRRIAFARMTQEGGFSNPSIYVMNRNGSGLRRLTRGDRSIMDSMPSWSPDGQRVSFARRFIEGDQWVISVINADGSGDRNIMLGWRPPEERDPAWSPDGKRIAFMSGGIGLMDPDGTSRNRLTSDGRDKSPAWQPLP